MQHDVLDRLDRRASRQAWVDSLDTAATVDEYGEPTPLLERFDPADAADAAAFPDERALMAQAAFITTVSRDASLAAERSGWDALHRARQASTRRRRVERLPRTRPADPERLAIRATSGALDPPTRRTLDTSSYLASLRQRSRRSEPATIRRNASHRTTGYSPCVGVGCDGSCGPAPALANGL